MFGSLRFYLASTEDKTEVEQLIKKNGGIVSDSPERATQLVDCDQLDARHPERISTAFIKDSVAFRALQDPFMYSGKIFTTKQVQRGVEGRGRMTYTHEDDARMLHFAKLRGWKAMESVPESVWRLAENERVTPHSAQSMHEHFRKQLKYKTPSEQRVIMTKSAAMIRARLLKKEDGEEQEVQRGGTSPNLTGLSDVAASADRQRASTIENQLKEVQEEKFSRRTRSRKPTSPLRISQRRQGTESDSDTSESADKDITSPPPKAASQASTVTPTRATPSIPATPTAQSTSPASASSTTSATPKDRSGGSQKHKRDIPSNGATISQQSSPSRQDSDAESVGNKGDNGIFFRSVWSELVRDHSKRQLLQRFFEARAPALESQATSLGLAVDDENGGDDSAALTEEDNQSESQERMELATDEETDDMICQLQIDTYQDMPSVVHALYYCSGNVETARAFLKGASPSAMWSPQDDRLLVNLVSEEGTDHSAVDAALARGDFATMMVPRDSDAILKRVQFLR